MRAPESIGAPEVLEIVSHGRVIRSAQSRSPKQDKLMLDFELPAGESQWIAARATAFNGAVAHTTPVYVVVNGKDFLDRANLKQLVAKQLKVLDWIEQSRLNDPQFTKHWGPGLVNAVWNDVEDARARYVSLAAAPDRPNHRDCQYCVQSEQSGGGSRFLRPRARISGSFFIGVRTHGKPPGLIHYKVNDRQYIEISPGLKGENEDRLIHIGFETQDAERLRECLASWHPSAVEGDERSVWEPELSD